LWTLPMKLSWQVLPSNIDFGIKLIGDGLAGWRALKRLQGGQVGGGVLGGTNIVSTIY
jgi:hypothetical protein